MPLVFVFLGMIFLILLFYGKNKMFLINRYFLLAQIIIALLSFFVQPLLITNRLQINIPLLACFFLLILYLSLIHTRTSINKSIGVNLFVLLVYVILVKLDSFYLLSFNIMPAIILTTASNVIAFNDYNQVFLNSVFAFFIIEIYSCYYLLKEISFASGFSPTILLPFVVTVATSLILIALFNKLKKTHRRLVCEK